VTIFVHTAFYDERPKPTRFLIPFISTGYPSKRMANDGVDYAKKHEKEALSVIATQNDQTSLL